MHMSVRRAKYCPIVVSAVPNKSTLIRLAKQIAEDVRRSNNALLPLRAGCRLTGMNRLEKRYGLWQAHRLTSIPDGLAIRSRLSLLNSNSVCDWGKYAYGAYGTSLSSFY